LRFLRYKIRRQNLWGIVNPDNPEEVYSIKGSVFKNWTPDRLVGKIQNLDLVMPCRPRKIVCLALNYKDLIGVKNKYQEPLLFLKLTSTLIDYKSIIKRPSWALKMWVEAEVAVVVKKSLFHATPSEAQKAILGVTIANDVTISNSYGRDHHLAQSKSLPTFCPIGSSIVSEINTENLKITTTINNVVTQNSSTGNRLYNDAECLSFVSKFIPLLPGDLVLTGTPKGALSSIVKPGDNVVLEIENIGKLNNPIGETN
jgi:2-keto-4-pentenoate hydratase/2-oxohepta-3-ene-1,7-dioic acid hydratase in catechol pathway